MALEIEWTETAEHQLDGIIEYLEANWTTKEIKQFFNKLEQGVETIRNRPQQQKKSLRKDGAYSTNSLRKLRSSTPLIQNR